MKKKNIFKLFSLLGLGSVVGLAAASCSTDGASADASKTDVQSFIDGLTQDKIEAYQGNTKVENKATVETNVVTKFDLVQTEKNNAKAKGWTIAITKAENGEVAAEGKIKVTIKATKGNETATRATQLEITGFKTPAAGQQQGGGTGEQGANKAGTTKEEAKTKLEALTKESFTAEEGTTADANLAPEKFHLTPDAQKTLPTDWTFKVDKAEKKDAKAKLTLSLTKGDDKLTHEVEYEFATKTTSETSGSGSQGGAGASGQQSGGGAAAK
ncbi:hypothetical protein [Mycoplasma sp. E35C]|uniref:hypothetical protein n=1 Tax=Mycoplasma sp. E35C TaxID=2801918 RepID=UPI001CA41B86|nr:hypothetical protein [Mycoplasma sp. E35C]QZX48876.1 hypothetical protein JJE79_02345 [Mycoplasma sp. E35C]